jgi:ribosome maturation factor RimP
VEVVKAKITEWLTPLLKEKDLYLVDIKQSMSKKIEVYIDSDTGVGIDDCATISRQLEKQIDGSGLLPENYILEVSSPGMSNPLKVPRQYKKRIGRVLEIVKTDGTALEGELLEANDMQIKLREIKPEKKKKDKKNATPEEAPQEWILKYEDIKKALIQFKF